AVGGGASRGRGAGLSPLALSVQLRVAPPIRGTPGNDLPGALQKQGCHPKSSITSVATRDNATPGRTNGQAVTVAELAHAKRLPADFLRTLGLVDLPVDGVGIPYFDRSGAELAVKQRTALKAKDGSYWPKGRPLTAYGQWRLDEADKAGF